MKIFSIILAIVFFTLETPVNQALATFASSQEAAESSLPSNNEGKEEIFLAYKDKNDKTPERTCFHQDYKVISFTATRTKPYPTKTPLFIIYRSIII
jgi:hypothetical protein